MTANSAPEKEPRQLGKPLVLPDRPVLDLDDRDAEEWMDALAHAADDDRVHNRNSWIVSGLMAGIRPQTIAQLFGLTTARVGQIAGRGGIVMSELRRQQDQQRDRHRRRIARHIYGISLSHPELTIAELAEWAEADERTVREALKHRVAVHEVGRPTWTVGVTDAELIDGIRQWAAQSEHLIGDDYTDWALEHGLPGKQTAQNRFGGWNNALLASGLADRIGHRGGLRPVISDEEMWASVLQFMRADLEAYSFRAYETYAAERGLASGAVIRRRLAPWAEVKVQVRELMRYAADRDGSWAWAESVLRVTPGEERRNYFTMDEAIEALKSIASRLDGPLTVEAYEAARGAGQPPGVVVLRRLGSWTNALVVAGLTDRFSRKSRQKWERGDYAGLDASTGSTPAEKP